MKQVKERRAKRCIRATPMPRMSLARQKKIRIYRNRMLREANRRYKREVKLYLPAARQALRERQTHDQPAEDLVEGLRRVRFDEDSNEVSEYAMWIGNYRESDEEEEEESEASKEDSSDEDFSVDD